MPGGQKGKALNKNKEEGDGLESSPFDMAEHQVKHKFI